MSHYALRMRRRCAKIRRTRGRERAGHDPPQSSRVALRVGRDLVGPFDLRQGASKLAAYGVCDLWRAFGLPDSL